MRKIYCFLCFFFIFLSFCYSQTTFGQVISWEGDVQVQRNLDDLKLSVGLELQEKDIIITNGGIIAFSLTDYDIYGFAYGVQAISANNAEFRILDNEIAERMSTNDISIEEAFHRGKTDKEIETQSIRTRDPRNLVLVLDISGSMSDFFSEVQDFLFQTLIKQVLITDDYFLFFSFGEYLHSLYEGPVNIPDDLESLQKCVYDWNADEDFTNIGLTLEFLDQRLQEPFPNEKTILLFITDGKHTAPEKTKYYDFDIYRENAFSLYSNISEDQQYKVFLLALGSDTEIRSLSALIGGEVIETTEDVRAGYLSTLMGNFDKDFRMVARRDIGKIKRKGKTIRIDFLSPYTEQKDLELDNIQIKMDDTMLYEDQEQQILEIPSRNRMSREIDIVIPEDLKRGTYTARIVANSTHHDLIDNEIQFTFSYSPFPRWLLFLLLGLGVVIIGIIIIKGIAGK